MSGSVTSRTENGIHIIEFHHPKGNSLPKQLLSELSEQLILAGKKEEIKVVILQSSGNGAFCAGASFDELRAIQTDEEAIVFFQGFGNVISAMKQCPKFIICRVQGKTVGGGVGLVAASDFALAGPQASIKLSELTLGIGPFVIAPVVQRKIGVSALSTLTIDAKNWKSAEWAQQNGLYNKLSEDAAALDQAVQELAKSLSEYSPEAMKEIKNMLWSGTESLESTMQERAQITGKLARSVYTKTFLAQF